MNGGMAFFSAEQRSIEVYVPVFFFFQSPVEVH